MTTQVTLTESELATLRVVSENQGVTQEEVLQQAIQQFLSRQASHNQLEAIRQAKGIWQGRDDLHELSELRKEWDRH